MRALETLVKLGDELEVFTRAQVGRGLRDGRSFGDVARALGISRQAAHRRFRDLAPGPPAQSGQLPATEQALRVFRVAREEARTVKATAVGSEHVLIAVLRCGGDAARALVREGVTLETARACARGLAADRGRAAGAGRRRAGSREVLQAAKRVTIARGERSLDVDAVLLGALADPHGGARRVLTVLAADVASIRRQLGPNGRPVHANSIRGDKRAQ
jgi:ATP-dependent Clp protease ATP-binding subunit ClpA